MSRYSIITFLTLLLIFLSINDNQAFADNKQVQIVLDATKPFAKQIWKRNVTYIIKDTFDLQGVQVRIPKGSVLYFDGGYLMNGILQGLGSAISAPRTRLFETSISFKGVWRGTKFIPEWFGAIGDGITNDTEALQQTLDNAADILLTGKYRVMHITVNKSVSITGGELVAFIDTYGNTRNILTANGEHVISFKDVSFNGSGKTLASKGILEPMVSIQEAKAVVFSGCSFHHHSQNSGLQDDIEWQKRRCYAVSILGANKVVFDSCNFHHNLTEQVAIGSNTTGRRKPNTQLFIKNCSSHDNYHSLALFLLFELKSALIDSCSFKDNGRTFFNLFTSNVTIQNSSLRNTGSRAITSESQGNYYSVENITIESNLVENASEGAISVGGSNVRIVNNTIINESVEAKNEYVIRIGGLFTGNNNLSTECRTALPFFNNSFQANKKKSNVCIDNNTIHSGARRAIIGIRPTENISKNNQTTDLGIINDVTITNNKFTLSTGVYPIYFPNGDYNSITICKNQFELRDKKSIVYMSPSSASGIKSTSVRNVDFSDNKVQYSDVSEVDFLFEIGYGKVTGFKGENNETNAKYIKSITNF